MLASVDMPPLAGLAGTSDQRPNELILGIGFRHFAIEHPPDNRFDHVAFVAIMGQRLFDE